MSAFEPESAAKDFPQGVVEPPGQWSADGTTRVAGGPAKTRLISDGSFLSDERLRWIEVLLDEAFVLPGTRIRFGLDGIIGLVPGIGDLLAAVLSLVIPLAAWLRGVPYVTLIRMLANVSIGLLVGTIPIVGDAFDVFWKANRRNYRLLMRSLAEPHRHTWRDWVFLLMMGLVVGVVFAIPVLLLVWLAAKLASWQPGR